jgi:hypothetical protein
VWFQRVPGRFFSEALLARIFVLGTSQYNLLNSALNMHSFKPKKNFKDTEKSTDPSDRNH